MTSTGRGAERILGSLRSADGTGVVRMEDRFNTGIDDLWAALTEPDRLVRWYGEIAPVGSTHVSRHGDSW